MIDGYGRTIDYIRISVTDRCNLRCTYCMPEKGTLSVSHEEILSYEEIIDLAGIFASLGIHKIRLTGGEPLVRKNLSFLVKKLKQVSGIHQVTLTTNGIFLYDQMDELVSAGIDGINISLDTLNPQLFEKITRRNGLEDVLQGFHKALEYPQIPLKINCVPMGIEDQNITDMAMLAKKYPVHVRFIEMMPIGLGKQYEGQSEEAVLRELKLRFGECQNSEKAPGNGPGHYYQFEGFCGKIGFISAVSHKFCDSCNRVRLTSGGFLKPCLQYETGTDLKKLLRQNESEECIRAAIEDVVRKKPQGHQFGKQQNEDTENRMMWQIGG
ncbi:MAG: GTP 3',8-cyclase MoaA [Eubacterium sp.]|nr:GTP 3',8-cyclase MoaA [Eubacterium sp.]